MNLESLLKLRESEDKVEFKAATKNFKYDGGDNKEPKDRRRCLLGYIHAFCNEGGGKLILGVSDKLPHTVVGSNFAEGKEGDLVDKIYSDTGIRVKTEVIKDDQKRRVLVIEIPSRPVGKLMKFEGVALMRTGESLREMSDAEMFRILSEQEPDFSAKSCKDFHLKDLDPDAIKQMKLAYSRKQANPAFLRLSNEQVLTDLKLLEEGSLNYAALILLGSKDAIERLLPQSKLIWEFRNTEAQTHFDKREVIVQPLFLAIEEIWTLVDNRNSGIPIREGAYISNLKVFNEEVIREAILNAIAHRDYSITSEVVIKQYPRRIVINNPGGFPKGVTIENLLTISSTPRCRLMAEVLEKTGLVERSGQGVDKIYSITLSEGKPEPNYQSSNDFQVSLKLDGNVEDKAFTVFLTQIQNERPDNQKLSVEEIVSLYKIKKGLFNQINAQVIQHLLKDGMIKKVSGHTTRYVLADEYYQMSSKDQKISNRYVVVELEQFLLSIQGKTIKVGDLESSLEGSLNRNQIKYLITKLYEDGIITSEGRGRGTKYLLLDSYSKLKGDSLITEVVDNLRKRHEH
jgi:ATP-dependent DNA helicase RecG